MKKILVTVLLGLLSTSAFAKAKTFDITFFDMFNNSRAYKVDLYASGPIRCTPSSGSISLTDAFHTQCVDTVPEDVDFLMISLDSQPALEVLVKDLSSEKKNYCFIFSSSGTPQIRCSTEDQIT